MNTRSQESFLATLDPDQVEQLQTFIVDLGEILEGLSNGTIKPWHIRSLFSQKKKVEVDEPTARLLALSLVKWLDRPDSLESSFDHFIEVFTDACRTAEAPTLPSLIAFIDYVEGSVANDEVDEVMGEYLDKMASNYSHRCLDVKSLDKIEDEPEDVSAELILRQLGGIAERDYQTYVRMLVALSNLVEGKNTSGSLGHLVKDFRARYEETGRHKGLLLPEIVFIRNATLHSTYSVDPSRREITLRGMAAKKEQEPITLSFTDCGRRLLELTEFIQLVNNTVKLRRNRVDFRLLELIKQYKSEILMLGELFKGPLVVALRDGDWEPFVKETEKWSSASETITHDPPA